MTAPRTVRVFAPAKINLTLHVTGQRSDGYHLIDSLVVFADTGDTLTVTCPGDGALRITGAFADDVPVGDNLVLQVARAFPAGQPLGFHLIKDLPAASGIGGGSADAAACYRALRALRGETASDITGDAPRLARIGADVPMCVASVPVVVRGIGEEITRAGDIPALHAVLVNPGVHVATPDVFRALVRKTNPPPEPLPRDRSTRALIGWLRAQRNDLEPPALALAPVIADVLDVLRRSPGCDFARMSGSGATCFGLYEREDHAQAAAASISASHPGWWVRATRFSGSADGGPQLIRSTT